MLDLQDGCGRGALARRRVGRVYSYVVVHDTGFSPNPFHGLLTLACCKPQIRKGAQPGDIIIGLSSRCERIVYAVQVEEALGLEQFWSDPRFLSRRPEWKSSRLVERVGDNIYEPVDRGFRQLPSSHSRPDGSEDPKLKQTDLGPGRILVGERFAYWGGVGPRLPEDLSFLMVGRGHRNNFSSEQVAAVASWFSGLALGVLGAPSTWKPGEMSWRQE